MATFPSAGDRIRRLAVFTSSGTWTAPVGVTYAIARIIGGGGGGGSQASTSGTAGGASSVFGTSAAGGSAGSSLSGGTVTIVAGSAGVGPGEGAKSSGLSTGTNDFPGMNGGDGGDLRIGATVVAGTGYPVVIGAGGTGGYNGANGRVEIEYEVAG